MNPRILPSARRHGVSDEAILHAYRNPIASFPEGEVAIVVGGDAAGRLLEIGLRHLDSGQAIFHAMPARRRFLRQV